MGECKIDHAKEDVKNKYESQAEFLPAEMKSLFEGFFAEEHPQERLNEVFHLLKKYDLISQDERDQRNKELQLILNHN